MAVPLLCENTSVYHKTMYIPYYAQGRLISIISPRSKQYTGTPTYTTTHKNKNVNVDKIKHIFIVLILPPKSVFKLSKNMPYTTCIDKHGSPGKLPNVPMR